jgi:hypothetical protein
VQQLHKPLGSKFGPLEIVFFVTSIGTPRRCLGFVRAYHDPRVQLFGWFCQGGTEFVEQSTLACAIDRLSFPPAVNPKSVCCSRKRNSIAAIAASVLWKALANRQEARRAGR